MTPAEFYAKPTLDDGFGSTDYPRKNPHRGLDFPHELGTPVPAYVAGVVVTSTYDTGLGYIIEVKGDDGRFQGYRHLRTPMNSRAFAAVGARVEFGTIIGEVSDTGTLAYGYHLCTTNASAKGGVYGNSTIVSDPWPYIQKAIKRRFNPKENNNMQFMVKREDNGKVFLHDGDTIVHVVHDDVVGVLNYLGIKGNNNTNLISADDHRRAYEAAGFTKAQVDSLDPGYGIQRFTGYRFSAGAVRW